jgi:hypothetical protein
MVWTFELSPFRIAVLSSRAMTLLGGPNTTGPNFIAPPTVILVAVLEGAALALLFASAVTSTATTSRPFSAPPEIAAGLVSSPTMFAHPLDVPNKRS